MLPGLRTLITILAGSAHKPFLSYMGLTFVGSYGWCMLPIGLGYAFGPEWPPISDRLKLFTPWLLACVAVGGLGLIARRILPALRRRPVSVPVIGDDEERRSS
jgi:membrane protein DedA with SNARE-associated domain